MVNLQSQNSFNIKKQLDSIIEDESTKLISKSTSYLVAQNKRPETWSMFLENNLKQDQMQYDLMQEDKEIDYVSMPYREIESYKIGKYYGTEIQENLKLNERATNSNFSLEKHNISANLRAKMVD